ncbi:hypothetical protein PR048_008097 [Dryococelus australis]|uniref:Integrase catalytic domain-containing protein n=1 Tax=Dryococelus australis TaxID=614101 RepID=A0ABQ9HW95_9NEOP|nr:hypothetical protein PR048_008097 [Dryococelus australis]
MKLCQDCQTVANAPPRSIVCPWSRAERAWERVHLDYTGSFLGQYLFIVIDAYSNLMAAVLITHIRYILADFGKLLVIVTDNGWQFTSDQFTDFFHSNGIRHLYILPWHPSSNGLADRTVKIVKKLMLKFSEPDIHVCVTHALWAIRTCPSSSTGKTPAEAEGRMFCTQPTQLHPALQPSQPASAFSPKLQVRELIGMMNYSVCQSTWLPGVGCGHSGARAYNIKLDNGAIIENIFGDDVRRIFAPELTEHVPEPCVYDKSQMPDTNSETPESAQLRNTIIAQHMPSSQLSQTACQENSLPTMPASSTSYHHHVSTLVVAAAQHPGDHRPLPLPATKDRGSSTKVSASTHHLDGETALTSCTASSPSGPPFSGFPDIHHPQSKVYKSLRENVALHKKNIKHVDAPPNGCLASISALLPDDWEEDIIHLGLGVSFGG